MTDRSQGLSRRETARALRAFIYTGGMWGASGRILSLGLLLALGLTCDPFSSAFEGSDRARLQWEETQ